MFVLLAVSFAIGFRFEGTLIAALGATLLLLLFSYSMAWIQALIGLNVASVEATNSAGFVPMFPFTTATNASRAMYNGIDPCNDLWLAIAWSIGIVAFFATWSTRQFAQSTVA